MKLRLDKKKKSTAKITHEARGAVNSLHLYYMQLYKNVNTFAKNNLRVKKNSRPALKSVVTGMTGPNAQHPQPQRIS